MQKKIAFVHCWLMPWGARRVFLDIIRVTDYDEACIFCLFSPEKSVVVNEKELPVVCALPHWIQSVFFFFQNHRFPLFSWLFDYRNLFPFFPLLTKILSKKISNYTPSYAILSSFAVAKNIKLSPKTWTSLYLHHPMQYVHRPELSAHLDGIKWVIFKRVAGSIKKRDLRKRNFQKIYCNSHDTARQAAVLYDMQDSMVVYPAVSDIFFSSKVVKESHDYFVYVGRLARFVKEVDRIIELFNQTGERLIVIWSWPDAEYLQKMAWENILFVWRIEDETERAQLMRQSRGLINLSHESFWLVTAESLLLWVPVFGYASGASLELVDKQSWILVSEKDIVSLEKQFRLFSSSVYDKHAIQSRARCLFSTSLFDHEQALLCLHPEQ